MVAACRDARHCRSTSPPACCRTIGAPMPKPVPRAVDPTDSRWLSLRLLVAQRLPDWRNHSMLLWAALIGCLGAGATVGFREVLRGVQWLMTRQGEGLVKAAE